jgi:hypothetical protein
VVLAVERRPSALGSAGATLFPPIGWVWALWISNGHHLHYASGLQWTSALVSAVAGLVWTVTGRRVVDRAADLPGRGDPPRGDPAGPGESS